MQGFPLSLIQDTDQKKEMNWWEEFPTQVILSEKPQILKWEVAKKDTLLLIPLSKQGLKDWAWLSPSCIATMTKANLTQSGHTNTVGNTLWIRKNLKILNLESSY